MRLLYFPDVDVLSIKLPPDRFEGRDSSDPDVTLFFDKQNRISEILIENASRRMDLDRLRQEPQFEEINEEVRSTT
jgi:hypothetical protein